ncbi:MAG TPA: VWA domain-containing protein, partial [Miltoncostaeaceae bacterium]|nr:VWA domain-containing protein [Miltoncostaeaceae bacterium]
TSPRRRRAAAAAGAALAGLALASTAHADVTVTVTGPGGIPVVDETVTLREPDGSFAASRDTDAQGRAVIPTAALTGSVAPYTAHVSFYDDCRQDTVTAQSGALADGASAALSVEVLALCAGRAPFDQPDPTGLVDVPGQRVLVPPGGTADIDVLAPFSAQNLVVTAGGAPIGSAASGDDVRITAPGTGYEGPLQLTYTLGGVPVSHGIGTLVARRVAPPVPLPGPIDLQAIVDVSGSMASNDPQFVRRDAVRLLVDLARPGDRLGAVGFDNEVKPIFDLTAIPAGATVGEGLKRRANARIVNAGGTDYNDGMDAAWASLTATPGVDPQRQKGLIFLTDGAHNSGTYLNGHLRFAFTPSGRPWPVCAIQLGPRSSFQAEDVARLKRIAAETGGRYFATSRAGDLTDIYFRCFGLTTGQRTIANRTFTFRPKQSRQYVQRIPRGLPQATFFLGWGNGVYQLTLTDPKGRRYTAAKPGKGVVFRRGATFAFFRVTKPRAGVWKVGVGNVRLTAPTDRARASVTTPRTR